MQGPEYKVATGVLCEQEKYIVYEFLLASTRSWIIWILLNLCSGVPGSEWRHMQNFQKRANQKRLKSPLIVYFYGIMNYRNIFLFLNSLGNAHIHTLQTAYFKLS